MAERARQRTKPARAGERSPEAASLWRGSGPACGPVQAESKPGWSRKLARAVRARRQAAKLISSLAGDCPPSSPITGGNGGEITGGVAAIIGGAFTMAGCERERQRLTSQIIKTGQSQTMNTQKQRPIARSVLSRKSDLVCIVIPHALTACGRGAILPSAKAFCCRSHSLKEGICTSALRE